MCKGPGYIPKLEIPKWKNYISEKTKNMISKTIYREIRMEKTKNFDAFYTGAAKFPFPTHDTSKPFSLAKSLQNPLLSSETAEWALNTIDDIHTLSFPDLFPPPSLPCSNLTEKNTISDMQHILSNQSFILSEADKKLGWSFNTIDWYFHEYQRQLNTKNYVQIDISKIDSIIKLGKQQLKTFTNKHKLRPPSELKFLISRKQFSIPSMSIQPKVHKLKDPACPNNEFMLKGRPIITAHSWIATEPSKLLGHHLKSIINQTKIFLSDCKLPFTIISDSNTFINHIKNIPIDNFLDPFFLISFDFENLYTNITHDSTVHTINYFCNMLKIDDALKIFLLDLNEFVNGFSYFHVGFHSIYKQKIGIAMGSYHSAEIANLNLLMCEIEFFKTKPSFIPLFDRYIDDGCLIINQNFSTCLNIIKTICEFYPNNIPITFDISFFEIVFLDTKISKNHFTIKNKRFHYNIYQKPNNLFMYPHFSSNHPLHTLSGIISTESLRYKSKTCEEHDFNHMIKLFRLRLNKRNYPNYFISKFCRKWSSINEPRKRSKKFLNKNTILVPTIFDPVSHSHLYLKKILNKHKIQKRFKFQLIFTVNKKLNKFIYSRRILHNKLHHYSDILTNVSNPTNEF